MKDLQTMCDMAAKLDERLVIGDNFYMLSKNYINYLDVLPKDVLINIVKKLTEDNRGLKAEIKALNGCIESMTSRMGRQYESNRIKKRGMIIVNSVNEIIDVCNSLTPEKYYDMLPYIEVNYKLGLRHYRYEDILKEAMLKCLNKEKL